MIFYTMLSISMSIQKKNMLSDEKINSLNIFLKKCIY